MKKYKILLVVRHPVGGIRTFFRYVYRNFDLEKYQFTLVAPELPEARLLLEDLSGLDLTYMPVSSNVTTRELVGFVTRALRGDNFDLVHSHGFTSGACTIGGALWTRTPHILTCHDVFTQGQFIGLHGFVKRAGLGLVLSLVDCIHCVSHDARENLLAFLPILRPLRRKVIAIPNGIEVGQFLTAPKRDLRQELGLPPDSFLIGFLGRFMSQKGFIYLVAALEELGRKGNLPRKPIILSFGDQGGFIREEKENVKRKGLAESVFFLPFVSDVASTLKGLDVVVMPSLWEACGLLAMEAMVAGVPLIGTDCVGLREVLRDTPASSVPTRDGLALSQALLKEMRNPTAGAAAAFAMKAATRFDVNERAAEIEKLMLRLLGA